MPLIRTFAVLTILGWLLAACATGPKLDTAGVDKRITPGLPTRDILALQGSRVQWGGTIVESTNLADATQIEVLGYPLDASGRPEPESPALRRFLVMKKGYLETADYAPGRLVTVVGPIMAAREGRIGKSEYLYPVVEAQQLFLWPKASLFSEPQFHFGIGIGIGI